MLLTLPQTRMLVAVESEILQRLIELMTLYGLDASDPEVSQILRDIGSAVWKASQVTMTPVSGFHPVVPVDEMDLFFGDNALPDDGDAEVDLSDEEASALYDRLQKMYAEAMAEQEQPVVQVQVTDAMPKPVKKPTSAAERRKKAAAAAKKKEQAAAKRARQSAKKAAALAKKAAKKAEKSEKTRAKKPTKKATAEPVVVYSEPVQGRKPSKILYSSEAELPEEPIPDPTPSVVVKPNYYDVAGLKRAKVIKQRQSELRDEILSQRKAAKELLDLQEIRQAIDKKTEALEDAKEVLDEL